MDRRIVLSWPLSVGRRAESASESIPLSLLFHELITCNTNQNSEYGLRRANDSSCRVCDTSQKFLWESRHHKQLLYKRVDITRCTQISESDESIFHVLGRIDRPLTVLARCDVRLSNTQHQFIECWCAVTNELHQQIECSRARFR